MQRLEEILHADSHAKTAKKPLELSHVCYNIQPLAGNFRRIARSFSVDETILMDIGDYPLC
jgi:hypothetical protein